MKMIRMKNSKFKNISYHLLFPSLKFIDEKLYSIAKAPHLKGVYLHDNRLIKNIDDINLNIIILSYMSNILNSKTKSIISEFEKNDILLYDYDTGNEVLVAIMIPNKMTVHLPDIYYGRYTNLYDLAKTIYSDDDIAKNIVYGILDDVLEEQYISDLRKCFQYDVGKVNETKIKEVALPPILSNESNTDKINKMLIEYPSIIEGTNNTVIRRLSKL